MERDKMVNAQKATVVSQVAGLVKFKHELLECGFSIVLYQEVKE